MYYYSRLIAICSLFLLITGTAQSNTVKIDVSELSPDSLGPWAFYQQQIDTIDLSGKKSAALLRVHDGTNWVNHTYTEYTYNNFNKISTEVSSVYNAGLFELSSKIERQFDPAGNVTIEIHSLYQGGTWVPSLRRWFTYSSFSNDSLEDIYSYINNNWTLSERIVKFLGARPAKFTYMQLSWGPTGFDTLTFRVESYTNNLLMSDSLYAFQTPAFLPQYARLNQYDLNNRLVQQKDQNLFSYYYSDIDTEYTYVEVDVEHTRLFLYNGLGSVSEIHSDLTFGSMQSRNFEHRYFSYDGNGDLLMAFHHTGTNNNDIYLRNNYQTFPALQVAFSVSNTTCIGCTDGSVQISTSNGIGPYIISISPQAGTINSGSITGLSAGTYTVCVSDATGGSVCEELTVLDMPTGITDINSIFNSLKVIYDPIRMEFIIHNSINKGFNLQIFDIRGSRIYSGEINSETKTISIPGLSGGMYIYTATEGTQHISGKVMLR